jgi:biotin-(acetyl-CoA carboxylase) ligase
LSTPTSKQTGIARGVGETGALLLETDGVLHQISGGEISLRMSP